MDKNNVDALKERIDQRTEIYIETEASCGEDVQKANILRRVTLNQLSKIKKEST